MIKITIDGHTMDESDLDILKKQLWEYLGVVGLDDIIITTDGEY